MNARKKTSSDARQFIGAIATKHDWEVNPDTEFLDHLAAGLAQNYNRYGYYLCPCRDGDGERPTDEDIICPCEYVVADHDEYGHCLCGLFLSRKFAASGREPSSIPERREGGI
ncbi:MAG: ferredoxin:thioredoxin reductase [Spirochaetales bacterium]|nr:ferredoxin:thioredoxin reductase [Spirochaetales bacterium]